MKIDKEDYDVIRGIAEDHYIDDYTAPHGWEIEFYLKNFSNDDFLELNERYIYECIRKYNDENKIVRSNIKDICWQIGTLQIIIEIYVKNKEIYKKKINLIKDLYSKYGYFMNYDLAGVEESFEHYTFWLYWYGRKVYVGRGIDDHFNDYNDPKKAVFYNRSRTKKGLILDLLDLGYYDILDEYLEECFLQICLHYHEESKYLDGYYLCYGNNNKENDITKADNITDAIKYLRKINYKLPKQLDEFWKERGI